MKILSREELLKAKCYSDIFSSDEVEARKQFRKYCRMYHPDVEDTPEANTIFSIIQNLYNVISGTHGSASVDDSFIFRDVKTKKGFEIQHPVIIDNGTCVVYHTATKVVLKYDKKYKQFYEQYIKNVKLIRYADARMQEKFERQFPKVEKHFETTDGDFIILLSKTPEVLNLGLIVASYEKMGKPFPEKQAAWIMNRLFNQAKYMQFSEKVFNGFTLSNLWTSPEFHSILLLNGWEYTTKIGGKMVGCPKDVYKIAPVEVRDNHISITETDLESIKAIGRTLFKGSSAENIKKYLDEGISTDDPIEEWNKYGTAVRTDFGKRAFIVWDDVPYSKL